MADEIRKFESTMPAAMSIKRLTGVRQSAGSPNQGSKAVGSNQDPQALSARRTVLRLIEFFKG